MAATHFGWSVRTKGRESFPERFWRRRLENVVSAEFVQEKVVKKRDVGGKDNGNYFLDFFFPEYGIDLEIDGRQHDERKEYDAIRDKSLTGIGIKVVRYRWPKGKDRFVEAHKQFESFVRDHLNLGLSATG